MADSDDTSLTLTLDATAGTLAATTGGSVTVGGSGTSSLTLTGAPGNINTFLDTASNVQYTGASNASGTNAATLVLTANDGNFDSDSPSANINITGVNDPPSTTVDAQTTNEETAVVVDVLANDTDVDGTLTAGSVVVTGASSNGGTSVNLTTGAITYTPNTDFVGTDNFTYTVDDDGGLTSAATTVTITVDNVNDAPVAVDDAATTAANTLVAIDVAANDTDVDTSDSPDPTTIVVVGAAANGNAVFNGVTNQIDYTPNGGFAGTDTFTYTIKDGSLAVSAPATVTVTVTGGSDFDSDGLVDSVDPDDDNDGIPDTWEITHGLNPLDASDASGDLDGDGRNNLAEYDGGSSLFNPSADDNPPVVTAPGDVTVNATGLLTKVNLGSATAVDALDGTRTPSSDAPNAFSPGVNTVTWSATDAAGNAGTATQTVNVVPLVDFSPDQLSGEGATVRFQVILNGDAVTYPVTVPYTVSGTAATDGSDHSLVDGTATITSGREVEVTFTTVDDGAGEVPEGIVVTMDTTTNATPGPKDTHRIVLTEANVRPVVSLTAEQGGETRTMVIVGDGPVTVSSTVVDPNPADTHTYDWSATDNALIDTDGAASTFTFNPLGMTDGVYTLRLTVNDGQATTTVDQLVRIQASAPVLLATNDSDSDDISDLDDGYDDSDDDGIPDYLDNINLAPNVQPFSSVSGGESSPGSGSASGLTRQMESEPGTKLSLGRTAVDRQSSQVSLLTTAVPLDTGFSTKNIVDFEISGGGGITWTNDEGELQSFNVQRETFLVVIPQTVPVGEQAVYRKYREESGWNTFSENEYNKVYSTQGEDGVCPSPGDSSYTPGLTAGHWCVQLEIEDGGPNDDDRLINGTVKDPGAVATPIPDSTSGGGSAHPLWLALLGVYGWLRLRAARKGHRR